MEHIYYRLGDLVYSYKRCCQI